MNYKWNKHVVKQHMDCIEYVLRHLSVFSKYKSMESKSAKVLLLGTRMVESNLDYTKQIGGGPARGYDQVEKATFLDNIDNYLNYRSDLYDAVLGLTAPYPSGHEQLSTNSMLSCAHARIKYWRTPASLPRWDDAKSLAEYHKKWYNTAGGATEVEHSVKYFEDAVKFYEGEE